MIVYNGVQHITAHHAHVPTCSTSLMRDCTIGLGRAGVIGFGSDPSPRPSLALSSSITDSEDEILRSLMGLGRGVGVDGAWVS